MPTGEAAKRRQQRGASWGQSVGADVVVGSSTVAVSLAVPPEATHMRAFANATAPGVRFGWNVEPTLSVGVFLGLRVPEVFLIPPDATTVQFILTGAGSVNVSTYFYSTGSQA